MGNGIRISGIAYDILKARKDKSFGKSWDEVLNELYEKSNISEKSDIQKTLKSKKRI